MTVYGLKLMSELHDARSLVRQAEMAEAAGLSFVSISDHIHPWLSDHAHSPFAWSVLGAIADRTDRLELATGVTCPIGRYHPIIVAQAAATVATMSEQRFTLSIGAGERLNEHVTGEPFPGIGRRHEMLTEAAEMIQQLWSGEWVNYDGRHFRIEDTKLFDVPEQRPRLVVAVSGPASLDLAERVDADGIMATDPDESVTTGWADRGGDPGETWTELPFAWAPTEEGGLRLAHERFRFSASGWKVMSELPNPVNFDAATELVRPEDLASSVPHGPDPEPFAAAVQAFASAGFERIAIIPVGDDVAGVLDFWTDRVRPLLED